MLSTHLQDAINAQINAEYWSAYMYLSMSLDAQHKGFDGVSNWFYVQWLEEQDHARILEQYMLSQDTKVLLQSIDMVPTVWQDLRSMFADTLQHEQKVTAMIAELMVMAMKENDHATQSRLQWFVDEQVEEEQSARDILSRIDMYGCHRPSHLAVQQAESSSTTSSPESDNLLPSTCNRYPAVFYLLDKELANRQYHKPSPLA